MADTTYTTTQLSAVATLGGRWNDGGVSAVRYYGIGKNSSISFTATGTAAILFCNGGSTQPFHVSIDGGAETNPTVASSQITLFTGLSDTAHTVMIRLGDIYTGNGWLTRPNCLQVTGAAPAISAFPNYGPVLFLSSATLGQITTEPYTSNGYAAPNGPPSGQVDRGAEGIVIRGKAERIYVWVAENFASGDLLTLLVDGVHNITTTVTPTNADFRWALLTTGLDVSTEHEYTILGSDRGVTDAVMFGGSGAQFSANAVTPKKRIAFWGDSITEGSDDVSGNIYRTRGWPGQVCEILGCLPHNRGIAGNTISQVDARIAAELTSIATTPGEADLVVLNPGRNNWSTVSGTNATSKTTYRAMVDKAVAGTTSCPIVCLANWNATGANIVGRLQMNQLISEVVTEVANARVFFQESDSGPVSAGTHFTLAENGTAAAWLAPLLEPYIDPPAPSGAQRGPVFSPVMSPVNPPLPLLKVLGLA